MDQLLDRDSTVEAVTANLRSIERDLGVDQDEEGRQERRDNDTNEVLSDSDSSHSQERVYITKKLKNGQINSQIMLVLYGNNLCCKETKNVLQKTWRNLSSKNVKLELVKKKSYYMSFKHKNMRYMP